MKSSDVDDKEEKDTNKLIPAHKHSLAGVSPVFRSLLYGPWKDAGDVIEVKETTFEAFDTMIKYIYHPMSEAPFDLSHIRCPQKLFELLTLATKYQILSLASMAADTLEGLTLVRENMIFTATVARNYKNAFEDLSIKLTMKCIKFLLDTTIGGGDILALVKETKENFPEARFDILHDMRVVASTVLELPGTFFQNNV